MRLATFHTRGLLEAGCDEAGRGCLAGPVVAAAVILPEKARLPGLNDSKQLTEALQVELRLGGPQELRVFFGEQMKQWGALIREEGIKGDG